MKKAIRQEIRKSMEKGLSPQKLYERLAQEKKFPKKMYEKLLRKKLAKRKKANMRPKQKVKKEGLSGLQVP